MSHLRWVTLTSIRPWLVAVFESFESNSSGWKQSKSWFPSWINIPLGQRLKLSPGLVRGGLFSLILSLNCQQPKMIVRNPHMQESCNTASRCTVINLKRIAVMQCYQDNIPVTVANILNLVSSLVQSLWDCLNGLVMVISGLGYESGSTQL